MTKLFAVQLKKDEGTQTVGCFVDEDNATERMNNLVNKYKYEIGPEIWCEVVPLYEKVKMKKT